jgi:DNA-binding LacI/PurR family transcriptional regulator
MAHNQPPVTAHECRSLAVKAQCDPRTIRRFLDGKTRRGTTTAERINRAIEQLGYDHLLGRERARR